MFPVLIDKAFRRNLDVYCPVLTDFRRTNKAVDSPRHGVLHINGSFIIGQFKVLNTLPLKLRVSGTKIENLKQQIGRDITWVNFSKKADL